MRSSCSSFGSQPGAVPAAQEGDRVLLQRQDRQAARVALWLPKSRAARPRAGCAGARRIRWGHSVEVVQTKTDGSLSFGLPISKSCS